MKKENAVLSKYDQQAADFMKDTKTGIVTSFKEYGPHFPSDKESRDIFKVTMTTPKGRYTFTFGQSQSESTGNGSNPPTAYDIFSSLTKYDPGTFDNFCGDNFCGDNFCGDNFCGDNFCGDNFCGDCRYDTDIRTAKKTYKAACKEYSALCPLYTPEELEAMAEIN